MSRELHLLEITDEQLYSRHKSRLVAATVVIAFFTAFVAFAPESNVDVYPTVTYPMVIVAAPGGTADASADDRE